MEYSRLSKAKKGIVARLASKKMRRKHRMFVIEGRKSVTDILMSYPEKYKVDFIAATRDWIDRNAEEICGRCALESSNVFEVTDAEMQEMSSLSTPADVMAICSLPEQRCEEDILEHKLADGLYLMLDGVQDPGNLGTIIRTAHWFGIRRIFASTDTVDLYNPKVIQSTMGSLAAVDVDYVNLPSLIDRNPHIVLAGLLLKGENIFNQDLPSSAFIAMGNEGNGLSPEIRGRVKLSLTIPPYDPGNHSESLNVAIATAITLAQFRR